MAPTTVANSQRWVRLCLVMRMGAPNMLKRILCHRASCEQPRTFSTISIGSCRTKQAWAGGLAPFLKRRGIKAIINLRGRNDDLSWWQKETAIAKACGIAHL